VATTDPTLKFGSLLARSSLSIALYERKKRSHEKAWVRLCVLAVGAGVGCGRVRPSAAAAPATERARAAAAPAAAG